MDIKRLIREKGETYESLAREMGVTMQAVSSVVNGHTTGATARYSLAKALGYEPHDLWPDDDRFKAEVA